jgi:hypothetical protein
MRGGEFEGGREGKLGALVPFSPPLICSASEQAAGFLASEPATLFGIPGGVGTLPPERVGG